MRKRKLLLVKNLEVGTGLLQTVVQAVHCTTAEEALLKHRVMLCIYPFEVTHYVPEGEPPGSGDQGLILGWSWGDGNQWPVCMWGTQQDLITMSVLIETDTAHTDH